MEKIRSIENEKTGESAEREEFAQEERNLIGKAGDFLVSLVPEKYLKKSTAFLAAFTVFAAASSDVFGGEKKEIQEGLFPENQLSDVFKSDQNNIAPFDWKNIADKIEIAISGNIPEKLQTDYQGELVVGEKLDVLKYSNFYKNISESEYKSSNNIFAESLKVSENANDFFHKLKSDSITLSDKQKILVLRNIGRELSKTINTDMLESGERIEISDDAMFDGMKNGYLTSDQIIKIGICGNIHTFLVKVAESIGMEAWLQSARLGSALGNANHIISGMIVNSGSKKEIVFINYDSIIPTGTMDYKEAIGVLERYMGAIGIFNSFVGNTAEVLFPVKSRGQEIIEKAAGIEDVNERIDKKLSEKENDKKSDNLTIEISPDIKQIKLNKNFIGLTYFNYNDFENNPYQSLNDLNALRGRLSLQGERFGFEADATILHMNIKEIYSGASTQEGINVNYGDETLGSKGGVWTQDSVIIRLAADYMNSQNLTKSQFNHLKLNWGATIQAAVLAPIEHYSKMNRLTTSAQSEFTQGVRIIYANPEETDKVYFGVSESFRAQASDAQNQNLIIKEAAKNFVLGSEVKALEGKVNLESAFSQMEWGEKIKIKSEVLGKKFSVGAEYEKSKSNYERFIPSGEKITVQAGYKTGPKGEINIVGFKKTEKYADAKESDDYGAEVKLRIILW